MGLLARFRQRGPWDWVRSDKASQALSACPVFVSDVSRQLIPIAHSKRPPEGGLCQISMG